jgi:hypothetical protein
MLFQIKEMLLQLQLPRILIRGTHNAEGSGGETGRLPDLLLGVVVRLRGRCMQPL